MGTRPRRLAEARGALEQEERKNRLLDLRRKERRATRGEEKGNEKRI
jgi:hypothetical protein